MIRTLPGLPANGRQVKTFSETGAGLHSEGWVVDFNGDWIGNFVPGPASYYRLHSELSPKAVFIIAGGQAYVVDAETQELKYTFGEYISWSGWHAETESLVFCQMTDISVHTRDGLSWTSERISWDGFRNCNIFADRLTGEACYRGSDRWSQFSIDLNDRRHSGGTYP